MDERFDPDLLNEDDPFELDTQAAHLFKHPHLGLQGYEASWGLARQYWKDRDDL